MILDKLKKIISRMIADIKEYWMIAPIVFVLYIILHKIMGAFCPSVWLTGFSCPGCGMTRAFLFVISGQFMRAFRINPSIYLWIIYGIYFIIQRYIRGVKVKYNLLFIGSIVMIMILVYAYGMLTQFPDVPPYVYTGGNLFERYVPGYKEMMEFLL